MKDQEIIIDAADHAPGARISAKGVVFLVLMAAICVPGITLTARSQTSSREGGEVQPTRAPAEASSLSDSAQTSEGEQALPSAAIILDRMAETYAGCHSYRDSGLVETVFISRGPRRTNRRPFTTAFIRPDRFRFEYWEEVPTARFFYSRRYQREERYIVWCKGMHVQRWFHARPGIENVTSLGLALAGATGVSGGSAHTIPALLLQDKLGCCRLTCISDLGPVQDADLDGIACFRIDGKYAGDPITVWIEKNTYLVRRIDEQHQFDDFRTEERTTYDPVMDVEIPEEMLEFDPPKQK